MLVDDGEGGTSEPVLQIPASPSQSWRESQNEGEADGEWTGSLYIVKPHAVLYFVRTKILVLKQLIICHSGFIWHWVSCSFSIIRLSSYN